MFGFVFGYLLFDGKNNQFSRRKLPTEKDHFGNNPVSGNDTAAIEKSYRNALLIKRELTDTDSERFLPDLASTLTNLALQQHARNDYDDAGQSYLEALQIYRELAHKNPQLYLKGSSKNLMEQLKAKYSIS